MEALYGNCQLKQAAATGDIFADAVQSDVILNVINGPPARAILAGFSTAGSLQTHSVLRVTSNAISVCGTLCASNVGIGTLLPQSALDVFGTTHITGGDLLLANNSSTTMFINQANGTGVSGWWHLASINVGLGAGNDGGLDLAGRFSAQGVSYSIRFASTTNGYSTPPYAALSEVDGSFASGKVILFYNTASSQASIDYYIYSTAGAVAAFTFRGNPSNYTFFNPVALYLPAAPTTTAAYKQVYDTSTQSLIYKSAGRFDIAASTSVYSNIAVGGAMSVTGVSTFSNSVSVVGTTNLQSNLSVVGTTNLQSNLSVVSTTGLQSDLSVVGTTNLQSNLSVVGTTGLQSNLSVAGTTNLQSNLSVVGTTGLQSNLSVVGTTGLQSNLSVAGTTNLQSNLSVVGTTSLQSNLTVGGGLYVSGVTNLSSNLNVSGFTSCGSNLTVNGVLSVMGQILQGGSNLVASTGTGNTSNIVCKTLTVTDMLTLGANSISFANGSASAIDAATWNYMTNYVYSGSSITPTVSRTLFTGVAQNHSAYIQDGAVYVFGSNSYGQLGLGDLVNRPLPTLVHGLTGALSVACGQGFTVVLLSTGSAVAMGYNGNGQLGDGTTVNRLVATPVLGVSTARTVVAGYLHTLYLLASGAVVGYGSSSNGQLGAGTTTVVNTTLVATTMPAGSAGFACRALDVGAYHSVLLLVNGTAYSFGQNTYAQLGQGTLSSQVTVPTLITQGSLITQVVNIGVGQFHTLLVLYDGTVLSCGRNDSGQCGVGSATSLQSSWAVVVSPPGTLNASAGLSTYVAGGTAHTVVKKSDGTVWVFGSNSLGQLGLGSAVSGCSSPTRLSMSYAVYTAYSVAAGANHTVILLNNDSIVAQRNRLVAFGDNTCGQVGTPLPGILTAFTPFPIYDGSMIYGKRLMLGQGSYVCGYVDTDGTAFVWGANSTSQVGDGSTISRLVPSAMTWFNFATGVTRLQLVNGGGTSAAALDSNGHVYTWGGNSAGQLGNNTTGVSCPVPQQISASGSLAGAIVTTISQGLSHCVALDSTGAVHAWGGNMDGQVGNNSTSDSLLPVNISGWGSLQGKTVVGIATGQLASAAIDSTGALHSWGVATALGINSSNNQLIPAVSSSYGSLIGVTAVSVSMGYSHGMVLDSTGSLHAWGLNPDGELGDGTTISHGIPVAISSTANSSILGKVIVSSVCGYTHTLALDSTGSVHAWGANSQGQVGNNATSSQLLPVNISASGSLYGRTVIAIAGHFQHSMALDSTGCIHTWGRGNEGQNGNNTTNSNQLVPILITLNTRNVNVSMYSHGGLGDTKLLKGRNADLGVLLSVGANTYGQVGDGSTTSRPNLVTLPTLSSTVTSCASGLSHSGATLVNGSVYLWGRNTMGQCSTNSTGNILTPTAVTPAIGNAASVYCGSNCTFITLFDGSVLALGDNTGNQLGVPAIASASNAVVVSGLANIVQISSGGGSSMALSSSGSVYSWGTNVCGATGQGTLVGVTATPTLINPVSWNYQAISRITSGNGISAVVTANGACYTCGANTEGGLGQPSAFGTGCSTTFAMAYDPNAAYQTGFGNAVVDARCGERHTILLLANGTTRVFGANASGQVTGVITPNTWQPFTPTITLPVVAVSASAHGTLNEHVDRSTSCTGNVLGALTQLMSGGGSATTSSFLTSPLGILHAWGSVVNSQVPVSLSSYGSLAGAFLTAVASAPSYTLVLDNTGAVHAFGTSNGYGNLGTGNLSPQVPAVQISSISGSSLNGMAVVQVRVGLVNSIALDASGSLHAWGCNDQGAVGDGTTTARSLPFQIMSVSNSSLNGQQIVSVSTGARHVLAIDSIGRVHAWGRNTDGQLGMNQTGVANQLLPVMISSVQGSSLVGKVIVAVAAGLLHSLALDSTGGVHVWGGSVNGQLGNGTSSSSSDSYMPLNITGNGSLSGRRITSIAAGTDFSMALDSTGAVHQWGGNASGDLGNQSTNVQVWPVSPMQAALSGKTVVSIATGSFHVLALDSAGVLYAWGANGSGEVGVNTITDCWSPQQVTGYGSLASVSTTASTFELFQPFFVSITGQHRVFVAGETVESLGTRQGFIVVCDQDEYITASGDTPVGKFSRGLSAITMNDTLPVVSLSKTAYDRRVLGVLSPTVFPFSPTMGLSERQTHRLVEVGDIRMECNAIGAGAIWVSDMTGPILAGDLITSSSIPGYGMLQAGPMPHVFQSCTVAKATCSCDFTGPHQPIYRIQTDADGQNVLDSTGAPLWVQVTSNEGVPQTEPRYQMRWLRSDGTIITQSEYDAFGASPCTASTISTAFPGSPLPSLVHRAAFIGCTYHCG